MALRRILRSMRLSMARLPPIGYGKLPDAPAFILRDLWQGNSIHGMHLTKGELIYKDQIIPLQPGLWGRRNTSLEGLCKIYDFSWLRDMRELGTDNARLSARALIADWMGRPPTAQHQVAYYSDILGMRLTNWLGHFDFFAASADDAFRKQFMDRLLIEGRYVAAMLPPISGNYKAFSLFKGVMVMALCMPEQFDLLSRVIRYLKEELACQILEDGVHIERNPEIMLVVLRDLVEIRLMFQLINRRPPNELIAALDLISKALRALRHGDGGLALFNGSNENTPQFIDRVLSHATQKRVAMTNMTQGGYIRCYANRATLIVDSGRPATTGSHHKHAGCLSLEFSAGRQRIFVNCGAGDTNSWQSVLGCTAAHSVLGLENSDCVVVENSKSVSEFEVIAKHHVEEGAHLLEMGHNGWLPRWGAIYQRILYLSSSGEILKGEERIDANEALSFKIRFHLHPSMVVEEDVVEFTKGKSERIYVLLANNKHEGRQIWWFRFSGAEATIEESIYFGQGSRMASQQIVLTVTADKPVKSKIEISQISPLQSQGSALINEEIQEGSDYVAIFHHQDVNQRAGQEGDNTVHPQTMSQHFVSQGKIEELGHNSTNEQEENPSQQETCDYQSKEKSPQIVQWALLRKL